MHEGGAEIGGCIDGCILRGARRFRGGGVAGRESSLGGAIAGQGMLGRIAIDRVHGPQRNLVGAFIAHVMIEDVREAGAVRAVRRMGLGLGLRHGG